MRSKTLQVVLMIASSRLRLLCGQLRPLATPPNVTAAAATAVAVFSVDSHHAAVASATAGAGSTPGLDDLGFEYRVEYTALSPDGVHRIHHADSGTRVTPDNLKAFAGDDYDDLGQAATRYVHEQMLAELEMRWVPLPGAGARGNAVLASPDLASNEGTLLVLMPGSGAPSPYNQLQYNTMY